MRSSFVSSEENGNELTVYTYRWYILAMFSSLVFANALFWVTFSPISDITQHYFGSDSYYSSTTGVNMLANTFLIFYAPGTLLGVLLKKNFKLRKAFIIAGTMTVAGAFLRYIAALTEDSLGHANTYWLIFFGQVLVAMAQPVFLNMPPAVASIWFPTSERDIATTVGSMFSPIGNAIGQIFPILFVTEKSTTTVVDGEDVTTYDIKGMEDLMLAELIMCIVPLVVTILAFKDAPPTPPSQSTKLKQQSARNTPNAKKSATDGDYPKGSFSHSVSRKVSFGAGEKPTRSDDATSELWRELRILWHCTDYWILFTVFSIGVGFFCALMTLLNQIVSPFGYSNDDAGTLGAVFILFGIVGAGCMGYVMEQTRAYRTILLCGMTGCALSGIFFVLMLFSNNFWPLTVSFAFLGVSVLPLLPVMMENCAEVTYPVSEDLSMGLMFVGSNLLGLALIFVLQSLLDLPSWGPPPLLPSNVFIVSILVVAICVVLFYKGNYKRMLVERESSLLNPIMDSASQHGEDIGNPLGSSREMDDSGLVRVASHDNSSAWHPSVSGRQSAATATFWNA